MDFDFLDLMLNIINNIWKFIVLFGIIFLVINVLYFWLLIFLL